MIAPAVIAAALAFWAPYSPPGGACPQGVVLHENSAVNPVAFPGADSRNTIVAWSLVGTDDCELWTTKWFNRQTAPRKCAFIAHEIGHSRFGLAHASAGIMRAVDPPVPGVCYTAKGAAHV
jgi:hypothetical protein